MECVRKRAMSRPPYIRVAATAAITLLLAGCEKGVLAPAGTVGREQKTILLDALAVMLAIVIPTIVAVLYFAWRYRATNTSAQYLPNWAYSGRLELVTWSIPTLVILFLAGIIWTGSHRLDPARPLESTLAPLQVQVVSLDWKWLFIYPEQHVAVVNELVVPAGRPIHLSLTSGSVLNSFFVPRLGGMIATMSGMVTQLHLEADHPGEFAGFSTQFSGDGYPDMHFVLKAVSAEEFEAWQSARDSANYPLLDRDAYLELARQSHDRKPVTYRLGDAQLFQQIVTHELPSGPGPEDTPRPESDIPAQRGH
jgi:cytochrome o ubiquinol oxidase subunit 2